MSQNSKSVSYLTHLHNPTQKGGGALKTQAVIKVLEKVFSRVTCFYYEDHYKKRFSFRKWWFYLKYPKSSWHLFQEYNVKGNINDYLFLDNIKQLEWVHDFKKVFIIAHNLEFENILGRNSDTIDHCIVRFEINQYLKVDGVFVCSYREKDKLVKIEPQLASKLFVFPNLISSSRYYSSKKTKISFIGDLSYGPNIEAVNYLCDHFSKEISREDYPKFDFIIAGRAPSTALKAKIQNSLFTLKEDLSDDEILSLWAETYISLVPLFSGSGTRLKIVESLFSKATVLSTFLGAEGFDNNQIIKVPIKYFSQKFKELMSDHIFNDEDLKVFLDDNDIELWWNKNEAALKDFILNR